MTSESRALGRATTTTTTAWTPTEVAEARLAVCIAGVLHTVLPDGTDLIDTTRRILDAIQPVICPTPVGE